METTLNTAPTKEPLTIDDVKRHLRIALDNDDENDYLTGLIDAARRYVEDYTWRKLITQTWYAYFDDWPAGEYLELPFGSLQSVTAVKYTDTDSSETTWSTDEYSVDTDSLRGRIVLEDGYTWPNEVLHPKNPIEVEFVCGYGDNASDVPMPIRHAMKIIIADLYENRETHLVGMSFASMDTADNLLTMYRLNTL